ncbi:MAG TPA: retropepsin-like aspartic protease [Cyclobacteriaceae bacterium]|nr:retropepsin-like aspartic protease [Cyclobacteriaceae bacterium]
MRTSKITILLRCILFFIVGESAAQITTPIQISDQGHLLIKATVDNVEGNFILDTGGGLMVITKSFSSKLKGLKKADGGFTGFRATGERMNLDLYSAEQVVIGNHVQRNPTLTIIDSDFGDIAGLISLTTFKDKPFTIDLEHKMLILETTRSLSGKKKNAAIIPLQLEISRDKSLDIFAYIRINDKLTLQCLLDSGAGNDGFSFSAKYLVSLGIDTANTAQVTKAFKVSEFNPMVKTTTFKTKVNSLFFPGAPDIKKENFKAFFHEGMIYDGVVSINWIGKQLTFDLARAEMIVH